MSNGSSPKPLSACRASMSWSTPRQPTFLIAALTVPAFGASAAASLRVGKAELRSAGPLAFGPDGVLFVGDPMGASVFALDTGDTKAVKGAGAEISGLSAKVAALLGSTEDQILINDMAVNPASKRAYLSVSRGRGPDATPVIVRTGGDEQLVAMFGISLKGLVSRLAEVAEAPLESAHEVRIARLPRSVLGQGCQPRQVMLLRERQQHQIGIRRRRLANRKPRMSRTIDDHDRSPLPSQQDRGQTAGKSRANDGDVDIVVDHSRSRK